MQSIRVDIRGWVGQRLASWEIDAQRSVLAVEVAVFMNGNTPSDLHWVTVLLQGSTDEPIGDVETGDLICATGSLHRSGPEGRLEVYADHYRIVRAAHADEWIERFDQMDSPASFAMARSAA